MVFWMCMRVEPKAAMGPVMGPRHFHSGYKFQWAYSRSAWDAPSQIYLLFCPYGVLKRAGASTGCSNKSAKSCLCTTPASCTSGGNCWNPSEQLKTHWRLVSPQNTNPQTKTQQNENKCETKQKTVAVFLCASAERKGRR